jgi:glycosyltransferase involved in cell wall biosynthesis
MEKRKRIAIVVLALGVGGAENMVAQLAANIDKSHFDVYVISMHSSEGTIIEQRFAENNIKVKFLNHDTAPNVSALLKLYKQLNKIKPDIVHTHMSAFIYTIPWIFLKGKKILHTIHNRPIYEFSQKLRSIIKALYQMKKAVPIAISDTIAKEVKDVYKIKEDRIEVIYNPVDINLYNRNSIENKKSDDITFINVARFTNVKNQSLLIDAFSKVREQINNVKLILVGDGELRNLVEKKVAQNGLSDVVEFTGNIQNVAEKLRSADVFVLPSHYEGLPLTILEAMASGLPIIATNVGGVPDIVKDNGFLFKDNDLNGLVAAMLELAQDMKVREEMGKKSIKYVEKFDVKSIADQYQLLYERYC